MVYLSSLSGKMSKYTEQEEDPLATLTPRERLLIENPPTEATWLCEHTESYVAGDLTRREVKRSYANAGSRSTCAFCAEPRPRNPKLVWPEYQAALAKLPPPEPAPEAEAKPKKVVRRGR